VNEIAPFDSARAIKRLFSSLVFRSGRCSRLGGCRPQSVNRKRRDKRGDHNPTHTYGDRENSGYTIPHVSWDIRSHMTERRI